MSCPSLCKSEDLFLLRARLGITLVALVLQLLDVARKELLGWRFELTVMEYTARGSHADGM
jgi:hypothetical protein